MMPEKKEKKQVRISEDVTDPEPSDTALLNISRKQLRAGEQKKAERAEGNSTREDHESKRTLESDEEEDEKYDRLNVDNVDGQEDATIEYDEDIKIEPFNMRNDMSEGHFDSEGTFIFNRAKDDLKDAWMDNIDWSKVKKQAGDQWHKMAEVEGHDDLMEDEGSQDRLGMYKEMMGLMRPGETVTKALKRLGGSKQAIRARQHKWTRRNNPSGQAEVVTNQDVPLVADADMGNPEGLLRLTELVDRLVSSGEFEAYGFTHERIRLEVERAAKEAEIGDAPLAPPVDADLDIFGEAVPESVQTTEGPPNKKLKTESNEIVWFVKRSEEEEAPTEGPYSSSQMLKWMDDDYFKGHVWVRRQDQPDSKFYSTRRIDFDLYT